MSKTGGFFDKPCGRCGAPANVLDGDESRCWNCVGDDMKERRAAILAGKVKWGPWRFKASNLTLVHDDGYDVDLERCKTSSEVLDWISQVSKKTQVYSDAEIGLLVRALDDLIDLQGTLCGAGKKDGTFDAKTALKA